MPYVQRDKAGQISAVSAEKTKAMAEWMDPDAAELKAYLAKLAGPESAPEAAHALEESDHALIRVVDDLVNVLVEKNMMRFTDLPEAAQKKLLERRSLRQSLTSLKLLSDDEQGLI
jgi:hypothetical protein